jgi:hypothetical protein
MQHYNKYIKNTGCLLFMIVLGSIQAQVNIFTSDFSTTQGAVFTTEGSIGTTPWMVSRSGDNWGARIHNDRLELTNTAGTQTNAGGWVYAYLDVENIHNSFSSVLDENTQPVNWYFNMRQIRSNPSGFGANAYGAAFVIASNSHNVATEGSGYAVVLGNSGSPDPIRFVKYNGGIQSLGSSLTGLIIAQESLSDPGDMYMMLKVTFHPATSTWQLWGQPYTNAVTDPLFTQLTLLGSAQDDEFTHIPLNYTGAYWQGATANNQTAFFNHVSIRSGSVIETVIVDVFHPEPISVEYGTTFEMLDLPTSVLVSLSSDELATQLLPVHWQPGEYNAQVPGVYIIEGDVELDVGISNPENIKPNIEITLLQQSGHPATIVAGWNFDELSSLADQGLEINIGKPFSRESTFEGNYTFTAGTTGSALTTTQWTDGVDAKYWKAEFSTLGHGQLTLSCKQRSSNAGPRDFKIQYRIGHQGQWTDVENSDITVDNSFNTGIIDKLPLPEACNNKSVLFLRWVMRSNTSAGGGEIATAGNSRIDEVLVQGIYSDDFKRIVTHVQSFTDIQVDQGTLFTQLNLPEILVVEFGDGGTEELTIIWNEGDYNADLPGVYTIFGEVSLWEGMENPDNIMAELTVEVLYVAQEFVVTFNVDMNAVAEFDPQYDEVYISGSLFNYAIPGTLPHLQLMESTGEGVYSKTLELYQGYYTYNYYINAGLTGPEPGGERDINVDGDNIQNDWWGITNLTDEIQSASFRIYPNPTQNLVHVVSGTMIEELVLKDMKGVIINRNRVGDHKISLSLNGLPSGFYFIHLKTQIEWRVGKVLIAK